MVPDKNQPKRSFADLGQQQLEIYARELQQHYQEERRLRESLESWNGQLEQVVREMTAMNKTLRDRLTQRFGLMYAYRDVLAGLQNLSLEASMLLSRQHVGDTEGLRKLAEEIAALELRARTAQLEAQSDGPGVS